MLLLLLAVPAAALWPLIRRALRRRASAGVFAGFGEEVRTMLAGMPAPANRLPVPTTAGLVSATVVSLRPAHRDPSLASRGAGARRA